MKMRHVIIVCGMCIGVSAQSKTWTATDTLLLNRIYRYADSCYARPIDTTYYSYTRYTIDIRRKHLADGRAKPVRFGSKWQTTLYGREHKAACV